MADALDANVRIYSVKPHPSTPHIYAVLTSTGLLVVSLGRNPVSLSILLSIYILHLVMFVLDLPAIQLT